MKRSGFGESISIGKEPPGGKEPRGGKESLGRKVLRVLEDEASKDLRLLQTWHEMTYASLCMLYMMKGEDYLREEIRRNGSQSVEK
jgi:hypothetical protein